MKYLYYSLYQFYTRIIKVQKYYAPIINIAGVIAALELFVIFGIINLVIYRKTRAELVPYHPILPTIIFVVLYWLNYKYFLEKERVIVKELNNLNVTSKMFIHIGTLAIVVLLVWVYLFDGLHSLIGG